MKILVVCQHFYPEEFKINDICFELVKMGNEVTVLTGLPNYPKGKVLKDYKFFRKRNEVINGVKVLRCSLTGRGNSNFTIAVNYASFAINSCLKATFMKKDFDVVFCYQLSPISMVWPGIVVSKMKKIPLIIHSLDLWPASMLLGGVKKGTWQYKFFYNMSRKVYNKSNNIFVSSKEYIKYFVEDLKLKNKNYLYLPNWIEENNNVKRVDNKIFDIVFAGNIGPAQDVESIVKLGNELKRKKDIFFHIVGDGLSKEKCEKLSKKYKLNNIKFYGRYPSDQMSEFNDLADAFIITLKSNEIVNRCEPAKLTSYMVSAKPIFAMVNGATNRIIKENNCGIAVNAGKYKEMSEKILKVYNNKQILKEYANNSYSFYKKNYSKDRNMKLLVSELEKVINN